MNRTTPQLTPEQAFLMRLEMERNDRSYLTPGRVVEPPIVYVTRKVYVKQSPDRDKMMFDAGRYAAGARDKSACRAARKLDKELADEDR